MEAGMAVSAAPIHVGLVRMLETGWVRQLCVTGHTQFAGDRRQLLRSIVGIVAGTALDFLSVGMGSSTDSGIDLILVAGSAHLSLR